MGVLEWLDRAVNFLGGAGQVLFGIALLIATPFLDRLIVRRKRINYRVLYNSRIVVPEGIGGEDSELREFVRQLQRLSLVVVRVRNSGSYDIDADDFDRPLTFSFGGRVVWSARISDPSSPQVRERLLKGLVFLDADGSPTELEPVGRPQERNGFTAVIDRWLPRRRNRHSPVALPDSGHDVRSVRMDRLELGRGEKAKLVVVLSEPEGRDSGEITKDFSVVGRLRDTGLIKDDRQPRRVTLARVTGALAALLALVLVLTTFAEDRDPSIACAQGELAVVGSTVFTPTVREIAADYTAACGDETVITVESTGSVEGVREVTEDDADIAFSDGVGLGHTDLHSVQMAVVVFHVIVHTDVGVKTLTTDELRGIYSGEITDWAQIRDGESLPVRIVGRGQGSGTRRLFEQRVLDAGEGPLTSDDCVSPNRDPDARMIRCERDDNSVIIDTIAGTEGTIGYADPPSLAEARRAEVVTAVTIDGTAFDAATAVESGYPFWTVEYLYARAEPEPDSLAAAFVTFLREHEKSRVRLTETGFRPCVTPDGGLELCQQR